MIRFFCPVVPGPAGDAGYEALVALSARFPVRAIPIGSADFACEPRWWAISHLFTAELRRPFVNVVCAPPGLILGARMEVGRGGGLPTALAENIAACERLGQRLGLPDPLESAMLRPPPREAVVYEPATALAGLRTAGCLNIAILPNGPRCFSDELEPADVEAVQRELADYDAAFCVSMPLCDALRYQFAARRALRFPRVDWGILPRDADKLSTFFEELCDFGTSATTPLSPATAAPRATTSLPLPPPDPTSSSRSSPSAEGTPADGVPSLDIDTSTTASLPALATGARSWRITSTVTRMWRWCMRRLARWRGSRGRSSGRPAPSR